MATIATHMGPGETTFPRVTRKPRAGWKRVIGEIVATVFIGDIMNLDEIMDALGEIVGG